MGGNLVEVSRYRANGQMSLTRELDPSVREAARRLAEIYKPAPCAVLDIARIGNRYSLVEFNPIHCAGWYAADVPTVLSAWLAWSEKHLRQVK